MQFEVEGVVAAELDVLVLFCYLARDVELRGVGVEVEFCDLDAEGGVDSLRGCAARGGLGCDFADGRGCEAVFWSEEVVCVPLGMIVSWSFGDWTELPTISSGSSGHSVAVPAQVLRSMFCLMSFMLSLYVLVVGL